VPYLSAVEDALAIVRAHHGKLAIVTEVGSGDETAVLYFVPQCDLLVRNVPQPQLAIQGARQEVPVILVQDITRHWVTYRSSRYITHHRLTGQLMFDV